MYQSHGNPNTIRVNKKRYLSWIFTLKNWLLPSCCVICSIPVNRSYDLCSPCEDELPWLQSCCKRCALPLPAQTIEKLCGSCLQHNPPFDRTIAVFSYQTPIDHLVMALKFHKKLNFALLLSHLLMPLLENAYKEDVWPEYIVPVPLHKQRLNARGFNQAVEIIRPVSKQLKIPLELLRCKRIKATLPQTELPSHERQANVKNAFSIEESFSGIEHVAIFDDVITTGHTVFELCLILRKMGVKRIDIWCCARTPLSKF